MTGRLTLPTDADIVDETIRLKNLLGADALRDCDGTEMPEALLSEPVKKYATYYTTRKDNEWAMQNPDEIQQEYLISDRVTARGETLRIRLMEGFHTEQLKVNTLDDPIAQPEKSCLQTSGNLMKLQEKLKSRQYHIMNILSAFWHS